MTEAPEVRTCRCSRPMEWIPDVHPQRNGPAGAWMCAHCDQPCERPSSVCLPCRAILKTETRP